MASATMSFVVIARYIFRAGTRVLEVGAGTDVREHWIGVEISSPISVDLEQFSREVGFDLIPAERFTGDELASVGVHSFTPVTLDGRYVVDGNP